MKTWFLKLLGYNYKIIAMNTDHSSEFWRCGIMKVPIEFNRTISTAMPPPMASWWNYDRIRVIYTRDPIDINTYRIAKDYTILESKYRIINFLKTGTI